MNERFLSSLLCPNEASTSTHPLRVDLRSDQRTKGLVIMVCLGVLLSVTCGAEAQEQRPTTKGTRTLTFQQGVRGYKKTLDTELWEVAPNKPLFDSGTVTVDGNNSGGESQVLMRFDRIIGKGLAQIPPRSTILSAKLVVRAFDPGNTVNVHRMLVPWKKSATWNNMVSGVAANGLEASRNKDGFTFGKLLADQQSVEFDVTDTVQFWVNGQPNYGWVFMNMGGNGWDFHSSESKDTGARPKLVVQFR